MIVQFQVIGLYVGLATVGVFAIWYTCPSFLGIDLSADGHSIIPFEKLTTWGNVTLGKDFQ